jgi:hypothetical protein
LTLMKMQIIVGIANGRQSQMLGPWYFIGPLYNFRNLAFQWKIYAIMKACLQASRLPFPFKFHVNKAEWSAFPFITKISWQCFSWMESGMMKRDWKLLILDVINFFARLAWFVHWKLGLTHIQSRRLLPIKTAL